jgi:hypothetical protein
LFFSGILFSLPKILPAVSFQFGLIALRSSRGQYFDIASRLSLTPQVDLKAQNLISFLFLSALCASQASLFLSVFHFFFSFSLPSKKMSTHRQPFSFHLLHLPSSSPSRPPLDTAEDVQPTVIDWELLSDPDNHGFDVYSVKTDGTGALLKHDHDIDIVEAFEKGLDDWDPQHKDFLADPTIRRTGRRHTASFLAEPGHPELSKRFVFRYQRKGPKNFRLLYLYLGPVQGRGQYVVLASTKKNNHDDLVPNVVKKLSSIDAVRRAFDDAVACLED